MKPRLGAMVVNFNGGEKLLRCVGALKEQSRRLREIVVVDNGSNDDSLERVRAEIPGVRIIELGANRGLPFARNVGMRELSTDLVLSVDSDIYLEPSCVAEMERAHAERQAAVVCPRILLWPDRTVVHCDGASVHFAGMLALRHAFRPVGELERSGAPVGAVPGGCLLIDRERALAVGGFEDLFFFYYEDLEWSLKLRTRGHRLYCEPAAVAYHDRGEGTPGLSFRGRGSYPVRRAYLSMRNRWMTMLIHYRIRTMIVLLPALLAYEMGTFGIAIFRNWLGAWTRAWWWLLVHRRAVRDRRRLAQSARTVRDRDLLEGGPIPFTPGFVRSRIGKAVLVSLSAGLNLYWKMARRYIG